jgi:hypothetical protein
MARQIVFMTRAWSLEEAPDGPRVVIPSPFLWPLTIFLSFWLWGWTMGEVSAAKSLWQLAQTATDWMALLPGAFLLFWLAGWSAAGVFVWGTFLFSIQGREVVTLQGGLLRVRLETLLGLGWSWRFNLAELEAPRLLSLQVTGNKKPEDARAAGAALPDYAGIKLKAGSKSWRLGLGLTQAAARDLMHTLSARFGLPRAAIGAPPEIIKNEEGD